MRFRSFYWACFSGMLGLVGLILILIGLVRRDFHTLTIGLLMDAAADRSFATARLREIQRHLGILPDKVRLDSEP